MTVSITAKFKAFKKLPKNGLQLLRCWRASPAVAKHHAVDNLNQLHGETLWHPPPRRFLPRPAA